MVAPVTPRRRQKSGMLERLKEQTAEVTGVVRNSAKAIKDQATEAATELKRAVGSEASKLIDAQKGAAAAKIHNVAWTVEKGARLLHAGKADAVAGYVDLAAKSAERASKYLEESDAAKIAEDAGRLARRYPTIAVSGLILAGLALGRFLKAAEAANRPRRAERRPRRKTH